ncbi:MAG: hypothetical protein CVU18_16440 [Betaproteobacteria bacterium HGW-Betaproteobacteria-12]|nr:MAG: hypothetical protein CVU18_16440 [Betaproteobacteria bacterium HGW-Betaproteobacteria-12]
MYFAVNPWKPGLPERFLAILAELREQTAGASLHGYVLIDGGFDQALLTALLWRSYVERSLYDDMRLAGLKFVAPHLIRLPDDPEKQLGWLQRLADACAGKPMISFLASAVPAERLATHFRPYLLAGTEDSLEWPVRWADTRVLPGLIAALTPEERRHLLSPLYVWMAVSRQGDLIEWRGEGNPQPEPADFDCWPLNEARFGQLVTEAEADAVLSQIDDRRPDLLTNGNPADMHAIIARRLALATQHQIIGAPNRLYFAMLGLIHGPSFIEIPKA